MVEDKDNDTNETNETKNSGIVVLILLLFFAIIGSWLYISRNKKKSVSNDTESKLKLNNNYQNVGTRENHLAGFQGQTVDAKKLLPRRVQYQPPNTGQPIKVTKDDVYYSKYNPYYQPDDQYLVQKYEQLTKTNN